MRIEIIGVEGLPEVKRGDDIASLIGSHARLESGDVVVVAQKIVSKAEGQVRELAAIEPSAYARELALRLEAKTDPRIVEVILSESVRVVRSERVLITETKHGFVSANAGVDHSNIPGDDIVTVLPADPDASAQALRTRLNELVGVDVGVIVSDTFGRPWRLGIVNVALGVAGVQALLDLRGQRDDDGKELRATVVAVADELAAAAGLVMGKTRRTPVVVIRGHEQEGPHGRGRDMVRPSAEDLFK